MGKHLLVLACQCGARTTVAVPEVTIRLRPGWPSVRCAACGVMGLETAPEQLMGERARMLLEAGDLHQAWELVQQSLEINNRCEVSLLLASEVLKSEGDLQSALQLLGMVLEANPESLVARFNAGSIMAEAGAYQAAEEHFELALEIDCDDADSVGALANVKSSLGLHETALALYAKAHDLQPNNVLNLVNYADEEMVAGSRSRAKQLLERALHITAGTAAEATVRAKLNQLQA